MKKILFPLTCVLLLTTFVVAQAGQSSPPEPQNAQQDKMDKPQASKPAKTAVDDSDLQRQVKEQIATNPSFANVNVEVEKATVTLTGTVPTKDDKKAAKDLAKGIPGVKDVKEKLTVSASTASSTTTTGGVAGTAESSTSAASNPPSTSGSIAGNTQAATSTQTTNPSAQTIPGTMPQSQPTNPSTMPQSDQPTATGGVAGAQTSVTGQASTTLPGAQTSTQTGVGLGVGGQTTATVGGDVQTQIKNAFKNEPTLASTSVAINVTDTSIELSGTVPTGKEKQTARRIAESYAGNRKVVDRITVTGRGRDSMNEKPPDTSKPPSQTEPKPPVR